VARTASLINLRRALARTAPPVTNTLYHLCSTSTHTPASAAARALLTRRAMPRHQHLFHSDGTRLYDRSCLSSPRSSTAKHRATDSRQLAVTTSRLRISAPRDSTTARDGTSWSIRCQVRVAHGGCSFPLRNTARAHTLDSICCCLFFTSPPLNYTPPTTTTASTTIHHLRAHHHQTRRRRRVVAGRAAAAAR